MYLKHNIRLVPYIWNWYAWTHLIPPHTASLNITGRHLAIMESFTNYPDVHYEAVNSNGMLGGPFLNLHPSQKPNVEHLVEKTKEECYQLIQLSSDIKNFDIFLQKNAKGHSLEKFYDNIPQSLKGMIELVYDFHNHPQIRFFEPLFYRKYNTKASQFITLSAVNSDNRPFSLSTPYITNEDELQLDLDFTSPLIDELMRMKSVSSNTQLLLDKLNITDKKQIDLFNSFFIEKSPQIKKAAFAEEGIRIRYLGHACILIETRSISVIIDPILGYNDAEYKNDRFSYADLPEKIDYVIITHNHQDHILLEGLLQLRHKIKNIVIPASNRGSIGDPSMKLILSQLGFDNVFELYELEEMEIQSVIRITTIPFLGEHGDLNIISKLAYCVQIYDLKCVFMADSNNLDPKLYEYVFEYVGPIDMLFIGMECVGAPLSWLYGPLFSIPLKREDDLSRRLSGSDYHKVMDIIHKSQCKEVCIYAMGMEEWLSYIMAVSYQNDSPAIVESNKVIETCKQLGLKCHRLYKKYEWRFSEYKYSDQIEKRSLCTDDL